MVAKSPNPANIFIEDDVEYPTGYSGQRTTPYIPLRVTCGRARSTPVFTTEYGRFSVQQCKDVGTPTTVNPITECYRSVCMVFCIGVKGVHFYVSLDKREKNDFMRLTSSLRAGFITKPPS